MGAQTRTFFPSSIFDLGLARRRGIEEIIRLRSRANYCLAAHAAGAVGAEIGRVLHSTIVHWG